MNKKGHIDCFSNPNTAAVFGLIEGRGGGVGRDGARSEGRTF